MALPPLASNSNAALHHQQGLLGDTKYSAGDTSSGSVGPVTALVTNTPGTTRRARWAKPTPLDSDQPRHRSNSSSASSSTASTLPRMNSQQHNQLVTTANLPESPPSPTRRSSSLESRTAEAYYKHLERFQVPRTKSWVTLQKTPPNVLKPLKLLKPATKDQKPRWIFGNPWSVSEAKVVKEGGFTSPKRKPPPHSYMVEDTSPRREPFSARGMRTSHSTDNLRQVKSSRSPTRKHPTKLREPSAGKKSHSVWDLSSSSLEPLEESRSKSVRFSARKSGRQPPLKPLPSPNTRRNIMQTRGNRSERKKDEESGPEDEEKRRRRKEKKKGPKAFNRDLGQSRKLVPKIVNKGSSNGDEIMTIDHMQLEEVTTTASSTNPSRPTSEPKKPLSSSLQEKAFLLAAEEGIPVAVAREHLRAGRKQEQPEMNFEDARDILEDVFLDTLEQDERRASWSKGSDMDDEEAAEVIESAFIDFLEAEKEEKRKGHNTDLDEEGAAQVLENAFLDYLQAEEKDEQLEKEKRKKPKKKPKPKVKSRYAAKEATPPQRSDKYKVDKTDSQIDSDEAAEVLEGVFIDYLEKVEAEDNDEDKKEKKKDKAKRASSGSKRTRSQVSPGKKETSVRRVKSRTGSDSRKKVDGKPKADQGNSRISDSKSNIKHKDIAKTGKKGRVTIVETEKKNRAPLASAMTRKKSNPTRGTREIKDDEDSTGSEGEAAMKREQIRRRRLRSKKKDEAAILAPTLKKEEDPEGHAEVMTVDHSRLTDEDAEVEVVQKPSRGATLPSARTRKTTIQTRGTRVVRKDEDSSGSDREGPKNRGGEGTLLVPALKLKETSGGKGEVMTIEHDHLTEEDSGDQGSRPFLPSARTRKNTIVTRGNREVTKDEDSTGGSEDGGGARRRRRRRSVRKSNSILVPQLKKDSDATGQLESMTIEHDHLTPAEVTGSESFASLRSEEKDSQEDTNLSPDVIIESEKHFVKGVLVRTPLPSAHTRKEIVNTRGSRTIKADEDSSTTSSTSSEEEAERLMRSERRRAARRGSAESIMIPLLHKEVDQKKEIMIIDHDNLTEESDLDNEEEEKARDARERRQALKEAKRKIEELVGLRGVPDGGEAPIMRDSTEEEEEQEKQPPVGFDSAINDFVTRLKLQPKRNDMDGQTHAHESVQPMAFNQTPSFNFDRQATAAEATGAGLYQFQADPKEVVPEGMPKTPKPGRRMSPGKTRRRFGGAAGAKN